MIDATMSIFLDVFSAVTLGIVYNCMYWEKLSTSTNSSCPSFSHQTHPQNNHTLLS